MAQFVWSIQTVLMPAALARAAQGFLRALLVLDENRSTRESVRGCLVAVAGAREDSTRTVVVRVHYSTQGGDGVGGVRFWGAYALTRLEVCGGAVLTV